MVKQWIAGAAIASVAATTVTAQSARTGDEMRRARQNIAMMAKALEQAVLNGAENLQHQLDAVMPDAATLSGTPKVTGFRLENYGVFFHVEVPALRLSIPYMVRSMQSGNPAAGLLSELRAAAARVGPQEREVFIRNIQRLEMMLGVGSPSPAVPRVPARGTVSAADAFVASGQARAAQPSPVPPDNPNEVWTEEVKQALIEAMLDYSQALAIAPDEWLTVAARDNLPANPLIAGDLASTTVELKIKGGDLAALQGNKLSRDEARKRVVISER